MSPVDDRSHPADEKPWTFLAVSHMNEGADQTVVGSPSSGILRDLLALLLQCQGYAYRELTDLSYTKR